MADWPVFDWVSGALERRTEMSRLEARGTVRLVLKDAGLEPATVTVPQMCVVIGLTALMVAAILGETVSGENLRYVDGGAIAAPYIPIGLTVRGLGPAWMAFECLRYYSALRRRLRLGLADPLAAHRFLLWGLGIGAAALGYAVAIAHRVIHGTGIQDHAWSLGAVAALAFASAGALGLAFFPPRAYRRWVRGRSAKPRAPGP